MPVETSKIIKFLCNVVLIRLAASSRSTACNSSWVNRSEGLSNISLAS